MKSAADEVVVIGYGNPLRGDDGAGWEVINRLERMSCGPHVRLERCHQLLPELAEPVSRAARVVFVDAALEGGAGEIECTRVDPAGGGQGTISILNHHLGPSQLLRLARSLYGRCGAAALWTIGGADFRVGSGLSPAVVRACDELARRIRSSIELKEHDDA